MAEKFSRDPEKDADEDYAKLTYHVLPRVEARVAVRHQLGPGRITASWREFAKDGNTAPVVVFVDETKPRPWDSVLEDELEALMVREKALHTAMRNAVLHSEEVMELRARDEAAVALEKTVFELAMERVDTDAHKEEEEEDEEAEDEREVRAARGPLPLVSGLTLLPHPLACALCRRTSWRRSWAACATRAT